MTQASGYTSEIFYHFFGRRDPANHEKNYCTLLKVLDGRRVSYPPQTAAGWGDARYQINWNTNLLSQELIVPTVTCFCDVPFDHLGIHCTKYGQFGIGFDKQPLIIYGTPPSR